MAETNELSIVKTERSASYSSTTGFELTNFVSQFSLVRIDYDKGIYNPGKVELLIQATYGEKETEVDLSQFFSTGLNAEKTTLYLDVYAVTIDNNIIAKDYRLFNIKKSSSRKYNSEGQLQTINELRFVLCSPDQLWTLKSGSYAWTGSTLGTILVEQVKKDGFTLTLGTRTFLNYKDTGNSIQELPQAYLVQYNEPFHDFVSRTANRCGEFLYWEDGVLNYGLPTYPETLESIGNDVLISQDFDCTESMSDITQVVKLNNVSDDYSYTDISDFISKGKPSPWGWWIAKSVFEAATQGDSLDTIVGNMVEETVMDIVDCGAANIAQDQEWKKYTDSSGEKSFSNTTGIKKRYKTKATNQTLFNAFYNEVRKVEKKNTNEKVTLSFEGDMHKRKLGDRVKINTENYTITRIYGYVDNQGGDSATKKSQKAEAIKVLTYADSTFQQATENDTKGDSATNITTFAVPPYDNRPCVRSAEPQEAVVFKNNDPDYNGRVRVSFLWQRKADAKEAKDFVGSASPWIKVSTPYSGKDGNGGFNMIPDENAHVMLGFMYNNIEMPYVSGSIYVNDDSNRAPRGYTDAAGYTLMPNFQVQTISSRNGANLTFIDGSNDVNFFNGIIPLVPQLWNFIGGAVGRAHDGKYEGRQWSAGLNSDIRLRDRNGIVDLTMSSAGKRIQITSSFGKVEIDAYTGITISAPNGDVKIVGKNVSIEAGNNLSLKSGANIRNKEMGDAFKSTFAGIGGKVAAELAKVFLKEGLGCDPSKACDLSFLRVVTETIIRPVEGTLSISSNRNVAITAGKGAVRVPKSLISEASVGRKNKKNFNDIVSDKEQNSDGFKYLYLAKTFQEIGNAIDEYVTLMTPSWNYLVSRKKLKDLIDKFFKDKTAEEKQNLWAYIKEFNQPADAEAMLKAVSDYKTKQDEAYKLIELKDVEKVEVPADNGNNKDQIAQAQKEIERRDQLHGNAKIIVDALNDTLQKKATFMTNLSKKLDEGQPEIDSDFEKLFAAGTKQLIGRIFNDGDKTELTKKLETYFDSVQYKNICQDFDYTGSIDAVKKKVIWNFINQNGKIMELFDLTDDQNNALNETTFWGKLKVAKPKSKEFGDYMKDLGVSFLNNFLGVEYNTDSGFYGLNKLFNRDGAAGPRAHWDLVSKGGILVSSDPGYTVKLKSDGSAWEGVQNPGIEVINTLMKGNVDVNLTNLLNTLNEIQPQN